MLLLLIQLALAQQDTADPARKADAQLQQLEQIMLALERAHPEIVAEAAHETHEEECATALRHVSLKTAVPLAICVRSSIDHGADEADIETVLNDLRKRYPEAMKAHPGEFWIERLTAAREELRIQKLIEEKAEKKAEEILEDSLSLDGPSLLEDSAEPPVFPFIELP